MDYSLREWLILLGVIIIVGVLVDGYRRVRSNKRGSLKVAIDKNLKFRESDKIDFFNGELPSGGARVVQREGSSEEIDVDDYDTEVQQPQINEPEPEELMPESLFADESETSEDMVAEIDAPDIEEAPAPAPRQEQVEIVSEKVEPQPEINYQPVEEVVVISVFAHDDIGFDSADIMRVILACGMRFGDMDIFHRNESDDGKGAVQFSMANAIKPGIFDLNNMEGAYTPGITFFLSLPGPKDSLKAFEYMLETAQCLAKNLNGGLKDEQHSDMTAQTIEHSRQRVKDFERRQLSLLR